MCMCTILYRYWCCLEREHVTFEIQLLYHFHSSCDGNGVLVFKKFIATYSIVSNEGVCCRQRRSKVEYWLNFHTLFQTTTQIEWHNLWWFVKARVLRFSKPLAVFRVHQHKSIIQWSDIYQTISWMTRKVCNFGEEREREEGREMGGRGGRGRERDREKHSEGNDMNKSCVLSEWGKHSLHFGPHRLSH